MDERDDVDRSTPSKIRQGRFVTRLGWGESDQRKEIVYHWVDFYVSVGHRRSRRRKQDLVRCDSLDRRVCHVYNSHSPRPVYRTRSIAQR